MRTAVVVLIGLLGIAKGIGFALAPEMMISLAPLDGPGPRLVLAAGTGATAALLLYAASASRTPGILRGLAAYAAGVSAVALLAPSPNWTVCVKFAHGVVQHHPYVPASASIGVSLLLLWTALPPRSTHLDASPAA